MFVSFQNDSGIRFTAHFLDLASNAVETRPVTGWVTGDDGLTQATVLVPDSGLQIRVGVFNNFLAVVPNGQEEKHAALLEARKETVKKALAPATQA